MPPPPRSHRWLSLVATIWLQSVNGPNSDFPVYSSQLKHVLSLSQVQLNNLAFASDAGKLFGWCSGVAAARLPLRLVLLVGAAFGLVGYGVQFLFLAGWIPCLSYWQIFALTALAGNGICWINTACYVICARSFPSDGRVAAGLSTSYAGLSARVYTALVDSIFGPPPGRKAEAYVLLNATAPVLVSAIAMPLLRLIHSDEDASDGGGLVAMFAITLATGACAVVGSIGSGRFWSTAHVLSLGALLFAPIAVPMAMRFRERTEERSRNKRETRVHVIAIEEAHEVGERNREMQFEVGSEKSGQVKTDQDGEEGGGFSALVRKLDFWLYFFSYMFGATLGLVFLNNMGQIAESRGVSKTSALVSLASSFGFFGRVTPPLVDHYLSKKGCTVSRPAFMVATMVPLSGAFFLLLDSSNIFLYVGTAIIGACSGAITSIAVSATPELFGTKNFALNHNVVVTNIPIGSFVFGYLAAVLYERGGGSGGSCMGAKCYHQTFIVWGSLCSVGTLLCIILYLRTR